MPPRILKSRPDGFNLVLPALLIVAIYANLVPKSESIQFAADDFQVKARAVFLDDKSTNPTSRLYTSELYSARTRAGRVYSEQLSGKGIEYNIRSRNTFYYTDKLDENTFMQVAKYDANCRLINSSRLTKKFFGSLDMDNSKELKLPNLLMMLPIDGAAEARHVFGLARLLVFFEQSRDNFQPRDPSATHFLKNARVNEFALSFRSTRNRADVEMLIKVPAGVNYKSDQLGDRVPMRVSLKLPNGALLVVDFDQVKPFVSDRTSFNLPVGRGCSQWLMGAAPGDASRAGSSQTNAHPEDVFSFKFELHKMDTSWSATNLAHLQSSFVAYDGRSGLMRVESLQLSDGRPKHELTLTDLNLGLKFHVSGARSQSQPPTQHFLAPASGRDSSARQPVCSKTRVSKLELLPCERVVPPASAMAKMGASEVRGVECHVFESKSMRLPRMIFEPVGWLEGKREKVAYDLSAAVYSLDTNDDAATSSSNKRHAAEPPDYRLVYHLAAAAADDNAEQAGRLLRLDVYDSEASHKYQVEVYNFQWRLTEGPNGDSQRDLFTLNQRCEPPETWRHLTEMQLELRPAAGQSSSNEGQTSMALAMAKLGHSPTRQSELLRGVSDKSASISGSQILLASSQVAADKIRASFKLVPSYLLSGPPLVRVLSIGLGQVEPETGHSSQSYSFSECFWEAAAISSARAEGHDEVAVTNDSTRLIGVFSYCFERCWIDPEAKLETGPEVVAGRKFDLISSTFRLRSSETATASGEQRPACQLFALRQQVSQPIEDSTSSWPIGLQLDEWRSQLEDQTIELAGEPFRVARVHLGLSSAGPAEGGHEFGVLEFEGVAFSHANRDDETDLNAVWRPAKQVDSFEHCQSECVANSTCRSYSFCLQPNGQVECLLASYDLLNGQIRAGLRSRMVSMGQTRSFSLPVGAELESIKFRVSKRCRLVAKLALDLFRRNDELKLKAGQIYVAQIHAVPSQEHCAEMCLKSNANYFKRLARFQVELELAPSGGSDSNQVVNKSLELYDKHLDTLRYWCDRYKFLSLKGNSKRARDLRGQLSGLGSRELREKIDQEAAVGLCYLARGKWARSDAKASKKAASGGGRPLKGAADQAGGGGKPAGNGANSSNVVAASGAHKVVTIEMDTFEFRYSVLYQPQAGLRMAGSKLDEPEVGRTEFKSANVQTILEDAKDLDSCARRCFAQSFQWCRSFDVIHVNSSGFYCVLNSLSLREALSVAKDESDLVEIRQGVNTTGRFEHFEPLEGYTLDIVRLKAQEADESEGDDKVEDVDQKEEEEEEEEEDDDDDDDEGKDQEREQTTSMEPSRSNRLPIVAGLITGLILAVLVVMSHDKRQQRLEAARLTIPEVNLARLSFSLPAGDSGKSSLLSQDQLEIRHQARESLRD